METQVEVEEEVAVPSSSLLDPPPFLPPHRFLENPNAETIDVNDFVDFSSKVRASFRMTTPGALLALSHITQTSYSSGASRSPGRRRVGGEIQPEVLLQEINTNLVTNPIDLQQVRKPR